MELLASLAEGFSIAVTPLNILLCVAGVTSGTLIGMLPGIGPAAALALLLPFAFGMEPAGVLIVMAGIYYGAMYGGSTSSILVKIPGEAASLVTCLDGYQMARKGRAGAALGIAAIGSFVAGTFSVIGLMMVAEPLANFGLKFGPPEYFILMVLALTTVGLIGGGSLAKSLAMAVLGVLISTIGLDVVTGRERLTFGLLGLIDGIDFIIIVMGLFAVSEVLQLLTRKTSTEMVAPPTRMLEVLPNREEVRRSVTPIARGTVLGFFVGVLPGAGASIASFFSYGIEKRFAKRPERFGQGEIEGVAGPEAANNAASGGALVPLLSLGIPGSGSTAVILGAMILSGVRPGPLLFDQQSQVVWALVASMYIGNLLLLVLNFPMIPFLASLVRTPVHILLPIILVLSVVGVYGLHSSILDLWFVLIFGIGGYFLSKSNYPPAPVVLGVVLGPLLEQNLCQALLISRGDLSIFVSSWICLVLIGLLAFSLLARWIWRRNRHETTTNAS